MYLGPVRLGQTAYVPIVARRSTNQPIVADGNVVYRVYAAGTFMIGMTGNAAALDTGNLTGCYLASFAASQASGFVVGTTYHVFVSYTVNGGETRTDQFTFTVV